MIIIVKTPGSQMGSPAAAEGKKEARGKSGERRGGRWRSKANIVRLDRAYY